MRKTDVQTRRGLPAANVKVRKSVHSVPLPLHLGSSRPADAPEGTPFTEHYTDERFTHAWVERNVSDREMESAFSFACERGWEVLQVFAEELWGGGVKVYSEGRSGGWAVVHGIPDVDGWDAIDLGQWAKFEKYARAVADDVPRNMLDSIYANRFEPDAERNATLAAGMCE